MIELVKFEWLNIISEIIKGGLLYENFELWLGICIVISNIIVL